MTNFDPSTGRILIPITPVDALQAETTATAENGVADFALQRELTHEDLVEALELSIAFNNDESLAKGNYMRSQFEDFTQVASWTPGYLGSFGTGYPFYGNREDGTVVAIPEITRFISAVQEKAQTAGTREIGAWACAACQVENSLPDLKTVCRPCDLTTVKPRDIFKALPDLDFWVILDENSPEQEARLQQYLSRANFFQSDVDIFFAVKDVVDVSRAITEGETTTKRLPIDLHIVTKSQILTALEGVRHVVSEVYVPGIDARGDINEDNEVPISPRSLHVVWEDVDEPYDFMKDFLLSFTINPEEIRDKELADAVIATQETVRECLSDQDILDLVTAYPKEMRQLQSPELRELLAKRWSKV